MLLWFESSISNYLFFREQGCKLAQVLKEGWTHKCILVLVYWNLCDLKYKVKQEERNFFNLIAEYVEQVSQLFSCNVDEIVLLCFLWLDSNEILAFLVIVLAQKLQELKSPSISSDA